VILAPAFPANGRTTIGGRQHVHGSVLPQDLAAMVGAAGLRAARVGRGQVQAAMFGPRRRRARTSGSATPRRRKIYAPLPPWRLSRSERRLGRLGWARPPCARGDRTGEGAPGWTTRPGRWGPILYVIGSLCRVAHEQVSDLRAEEDVCCLEIAPSTLASGPGSPEWCASTAGIDAAVEAGHDVVLSIASLGKGDETEDPRLARPSHGLRRRTPSEAAASC
jgi:hypothetical protein